MDYFTSEKSSSSSSSQEWFNLCSELPTADYLTKSSDGSQYELRPSMPNVCRVLGLLLGVSTPWRSLEELELFWNKKVFHSSRIKTSQSILLFRAPFSDTEKITRELGAINFMDRDYTLEIELEDAHGLAAVKNKRRISSESTLWSYPKLLTSLQNNHVKAGHSMAQDILLHLLRASVLNDSYLLKYGPRDAYFGLLHPFLATRWGEERLGVKLSEEGGISATNESVAAPVARARAAQEELLAHRALELVMHLPFEKKHQDYQVKLLAWVLDYAATESSPENIAIALRRQPARSSLLEHSQILSAIRRRKDAELLLHMVFVFHKKGWRPLAMESCPEPRRSGRLSLVDMGRMLLFCAKDIYTKYFRSFNNISNVLFSIRR